MSVFEDVSKLKPSHLIIGFALFISTICPGVLTIYMFKPALFESLDSFKLLLFAAALSLPFVALNCIAFHKSSEWTGDAMSGDTKRFPDLVFLASLMAWSVQYGMLFYSYLSKAGFRQHLTYLFLAEALMMLLLSVGSWLVFRSHKASGAET